MKYKNKSFLEDLFIIFIICIIIYAIFTFFFSENENSIENTQNNEIVQQKQEEIKKEEILPLIEEKKIQEENDIKIENETIKKEIQGESNLPKEEIKPLIEVSNDDVIEEEKIVIPSSAKLFLEELQEKILEDINNEIAYKTFVSIRLTVLKNGDYEQLTLMDGDKKYFDLIKPILLKYFPLNIDNSIKNEFPRYFRLKIEQQ